MQAIESVHFCWIFLSTFMHYHIVNVHDIVWATPYIQTCREAKVKHKFLLLAILCNVFALVAMLEKTCTLKK